jgi:polysaccharide pyruvyl transferase WcaK-like protein
MDVSGGDSFAELYGPRRFSQHKALKQLALRTGKPLILLPQTFGPFQSPSVIAEVREILTRSALAATRDVTGVQELEKLFGAGVAQSVRTCPDMAFFLDPVPVPEGREPAVARPGPGWTLIGLNLSALLWSGVDRFGLRVDYRELVRGIAEWAAGRRNTRLVLIPHVVALEAHEGAPANLEGLNQQSDTVACREAMGWLGGEFAGRVVCLDGPYGAAQTKHLIGRCDFMIGARMHACIGAVSQCVPAATLAYSKKAAGVMGQAGVSDTVVDLRECSLGDCIAQVDAIFARRHEVRARLEGCIPEVQRRIEAFFTRDVAEVLGRLAGAGRGG